MLQYQFENGVCVGRDALRDDCDRIASAFIGSMGLPTFREVTFEVPGSRCELQYDPTPLTGAKVRVSFFYHDVLQNTCILPESTARSCVNDILFDNLKACALGVMFK